VLAFSRGDATAGRQVSLLPDPAAPREVSWVAQLGSPGAEAAAKEARESSTSGGALLCAVPSSCLGGLRRLALSSSVSAPAACDPGLQRSLEENSIQGSHHSPRILGGCSRSSNRLTPMTMPTTSHALLPMHAGEGQELGPLACPQASLMLPGS
jgi:hypothetical protein